MPTKLNSFKVKKKTKRHKPSRRLIPQNIAHNKKNRFLFPSHWHIQKPTESET